MIYIEIIPREITNVVREPFKHRSHIRRTIDDTCGYKTLDDAIVNSENVGLGLFGNVVPENLFFVFGKTIEAFYRVQTELPILPPPFDEFGDFKGHCDSKKCSSENKHHADNRAVIFCKVVNADIFCEPFWAEKKKGSGPTERYEISWRELQEFKNVLDNCSHILLAPNV